MADLRDFHENEARLKEIQNFVIEQSKLSAIEHSAKDKEMLKILEGLYPFLQKLHNAKVQGGPLSLDEEKMLVQLKAGFERMLDYFILSQEARMKRMMEAADKQYYYLKDLASKGDKKAKEMYLELKKLKDDQIKTDNEHRTN